MVEEGGGGRKRVKSVGGMEMSRRKVGVGILGFPDRGRGIKRHSLGYITVGDKVPKRTH